MVWNIYLRTYDRTKKRSKSCLGSRRNTLQICTRSPMVEIQYGGYGTGNSYSSGCRLEKNFGSKGCCRVIRVAISNRTDPATTDVKFRKIGNDDYIWNWKLAFCLHAEVSLISSSHHCRERQLWMPTFETMFEAHAKSYTGNNCRSGSRRCKHWQAPVPWVGECIGIGFIQHFSSTFVLASILLP